MTLVHYLLLIGFLMFLKCLFSLMIKKKTQIAFLVLIFMS